jgi:hypothetical protein
MKSNGRLDLLQPPSTFSLYDKIPVATSSYNDAMTGNWETTPLSKAFFSPENQQILQNGIRAGVHRMSGNKYVIGNQSNSDLKIIMRAKFLEHSMNRPGNIREQIEELNTHVLNYCIPSVFGQAKGYMRYLHDVSTIAVPLASPVLANMSDKTLELKPFF